MTATATKSKKSNNGSSQQEVKQTLKSIEDVRPIGERLVVRPDPVDEASPGGIVLPHGDAKPVLAGTVLAIGPGRVLENGDTYPMTCRVGDRVLYQHFGGVEFKYGEEELVVLRESELLLVL